MALVWVPHSYWLVCWEHHSANLAQPVLPGKSMGSLVPRACSRSQSNFCPFPVKVRTLPHSQAFNPFSPGNATWTLAYPSLRPYLHSREDRRCCNRSSRVQFSGSSKDPLNWTQRALPPAACTPARSKGSWREHWLLSASCCEDGGETWNKVHQLLLGN